MPGKFDITSEGATDWETVEGPAVEMEVRSKNGSHGEEEEFRWVARMTLRRLHTNILALGVIDATIQQFAGAWGSFNGSYPVAVELSADFNSDSTWTILMQRLDPQEQRGSLLMAETIEMMSATDWADVNWNF